MEVVGEPGVGGSAPHTVQVMITMMVMTMMIMSGSIPVASLLTLYRSINSTNDDDDDGDDDNNYNDHRQMLGEKL